MTRPLANILYHTAEPEEPDHKNLHEVPETHPLYRYMCAMADKVELDFYPKLYIREDSPEAAYANRCRYAPHHSYIVIAERAMRECTSRTIAFFLAHEVGHFTRENMASRKRHHREYMADATAGYILGQEKAAQALFDYYQNYFSGIKKVMRIMGKRSHPSLANRLGALLRKEWHHTVLNGIEDRTSTNSINPDMLTMMELMGFALRLPEDGRQR